MKITGGQVAEKKDRHWIVQKFIAFCMFFVLFFRTIFFTDKAPNPGQAITRNAKNARGFGPNGGGSGGGTIKLCPGGGCGM